MIKQIGTKLYYCNLTGNVIKLIGDMQGYIKETTFDEDYEIYTELKERDKNSIGLLVFEYGEYPKLSVNSTGVMVDLETKELIFSYDELPIPPQEPDRVDILEDKISILEQENNNQDSKITSNMLATTELFEMVLMMPSTQSTLNENTRDSKGGNNMIEVYATLIIEGHKTLEQVPTVIREQVRLRLVELGIPGYDK